MATAKNAAASISTAKQPSEARSFTLATVSRRLRVRAHLSLEDEEVQVQPSACCRIPGWGILALDPWSLQIFP